MKNYEDHESSKIESNYGKNLINSWFEFRENRLQDKYYVKKFGGRF